jgi:catechol 2,3-dioxygenase-like lactoylglutathione lyase family enzyme
VGINSFPLVHIGWITENLEETRRFFEKLGIGPFRLFEPEYDEKFYLGEKGNFKMKFALASLGPIEIEIIEPLAGKSVYNEFLEKTGGGFHHLAYQVPDLDEALRMLEKSGLKGVMSGARKGLRFAYLQGEWGPIFELVERK